MAQPSPYCRIMTIDYVPENGGPLVLLGFDKHQKFIIGAHIEYEEINNTSTACSATKAGYLKVIKVDVFTGQTTVCPKLPLPWSAVDEEYYSYNYHYAFNPSESSIIILHHRLQHVDGHVDHAYIFSRLIFETGSLEEFELDNTLKFKWLNNVSYMKPFGTIVLGSVDKEIGIYSVEFNQENRVVLNFIDFLPSVFQHLPYTLTKTKIFAIDTEHPCYLMHVYEANKKNYYTLEHITKQLNVDKLLGYQCSPFVEYDDQIVTMKESKCETGYVYYLQKLILTKDCWEFENLFPLITSLSMFSWPLIPIYCSSSFAFSFATFNIHRSDRRLCRHIVLPPLNLGSSLQDLAFQSCPLLHGGCSYELLNRLKIPVLLIRRYFGPNWTFQMEDNECFLLATNFQSS